MPTAYTAESLDEMSYKHKQKIIRSMKKKHKKK